MQPQNPYGLPQPPHPPQGPSMGPQGSFPPGQTYPGGQPYPPQPPAPGQQFHPGQPLPPGVPQAPGQPFQAAPGQPAIPGQPPQPGRPPVPQYQVPQHLQAPGQQPDNLPPPPDAPTTPYDFFMQPKPMPSVNPLPVTGKKLVNPTTVPRDASNSKNKFIFMAGGALLVVIIMFVIVAMAPKDQTGTQLFGVAQAQQEVVRICQDGTRKSKQRSTRNFAITCATGVTTNQRELIAYIDKQGYDYNAKSIGAKADGQIDARLKSATASSAYDDTFRDIMEKQLNTYNSELTQQLGVATGAGAREVLTKSQRSAELLLQMVKDNSDKTEVAAE